MEIGKIQLTPELLELGFKPESREIKAKIEISDELSLHISKDTRKGKEEFLYTEAKDYWNDSCLLGSFSIEKLKTLIGVLKDCYGKELKGSN